MGNTISGGSELPEKSDSMSYGHPTPDYSTPSRSNAPASGITENQGSQSMTHSDRTSTRKTRSKRREHREVSTKGTLVVTVGLFLAGALTAKALSSSRRARRAEHSARAWERMCLTMAGKSNQTLAKPSGLSKFNDTELNNKHWPNHNQHQHNASWRERMHRHSHAPPEMIAANEERNLHKNGMSTAAETVQSMARQEDGQSHNNVNTHSTTKNSLYSAIHPHEDWDWTPADHPKPGKPWRKSRLPPWSVGFTSTPKAQESIQSMNTSVSQEDRLLRSAIWPTSNAANTNETEFIAEEVYNEMNKKKDSTEAEKVGTVLEKKRLNKEEEVGWDTIIDEEKTSIKSEEAKKRKVFEERKHWNEKFMKEKSRREAAENHARNKEEERFEEIQKIEKNYLDNVKAKRLNAIRQREIEEKKKTIMEEELKSQSNFFTNESEQFQNLQRQMWALNAWSQALEEKLRRHDSREYFFKR